MLFQDGAYAFRGKRAVFHRACRPTGDELNRLLDSLSRRIVRVLERFGLLLADPECPSVDLVPDSSLDQWRRGVYRQIVTRCTIWTHSLA